MILSSKRVLEKQCRKKDETEEILKSGLVDEHFIGKIFPTG